MQQASVVLTLQAPVSPDFEAVQIKDSGIESPWPFEQSSFDMTGRAACWRTSLVEPPKFVICFKIKNRKLTVSIAYTRLFFR